MNKERKLAIHPKDMAWIGMEVSVHQNLVLHQVEDPTLKILYLHTLHYIHTINIIFFRPVTCNLLCSKE